ncbi:hypothetical protein EDD86DRAFT_191688 [Gorgonomyces haynaldii]|nr:hypothetical protein EDD86DRAFT_191688 [Gorgonomyces haynaldii]
MCNLTFTRPYNMKSHYLGHFDVKPFGCSVCSRRFLRINDLKRHQRIHGAEKEHSCTMCPQTFSREEALRRHELACLYEQTSKQEFLDMKQEATPPQSPVNPCSLDFILN